MVRRHRQFGLVRTYISNIILNYKRILYIEVAYINCFINSLNTYADKTLVLSSNVLFTYLFISKKLYYNGGLFLNKSIDLTNIGL